MDRSLYHTTLRCAKDLLCDVKVTFKTNEEQGYVCTDTYERTSILTDRGIVSFSFDDVESISLVRE